MSTLHSGQMSRAKTYGFLWQSQQSARCWQGNHENFGSSFLQITHQKFFEILCNIHPVWFRDLNIQKSERVTSYLWALIRRNCSSLFIILLIFLFFGSSCSFFHRVYYSLVIKVPVSSSMTSIFVWIGQSTTNTQMSLIISSSALSTSLGS